MTKRTEQEENKNNFFTTKIPSLKPQSIHLNHRTMFYCLYTAHRQTTQEPVVQWLSLLFVQHFFHKLGHLWCFMKFHILYFGVFYSFRYFVGSGSRLKTVIGTEVYISLSFGGWLSHGYLFHIQISQFYNLFI